ncbi:Cof-type HAD-IIB family hydrolase [Cellulomonas hominis]|uniref:Cof-type HAD-IIB family hydrolase n=1 Tax=Cellulomonas hominis TaxID=156981 RepID=UPI001C125A8C|nr:Cof-type HAD-IIB family hydrolase [Cellulomonas hominis]MBU5421851.1 Cof-type HAD-IIB family hydrolase [Cellulomonas hominis]
MPLATSVTPVLDPPALPQDLDVRLVVSDMDGSLLDERGRVPATFWPVLDELERRGIAFCPASGRQYANLRELFGDRGRDLVYIAENGAYVAQGGEALSTDPLPAEEVPVVVQRVRDLAAAGRDVGMVLCGQRSGYVERGDGPFAEHARRHYAWLEQVDDVTAVDDVVLKIAVFDFGSIEDVAAPAFADLADRLRVVVSGQHWLDVMNPAADKGHALRRVQERLGVTAAQTMAFGDYLNDAGMLDAAHWSFAMDNAHPDVRARARYVAPGNARDGVVRTIAAALGVDVGQ